jgi:hypothetical protein
MIQKRQPFFFSSYLLLFHLKQDIVMSKYATFLEKGKMHFRFNPSLHGTSQPLIWTSVNVETVKNVDDCSVHVIICLDKLHFILTIKQSSLTHKRSLMVLLEKNTIVGTRIMRVTQRIN